MNSKNIHSKYIKLPYGFLPRHYQSDLLRAFFIDGYKRIISICHRRAGKTLTSLNLLVGAAMQRVGTYYFAFPTLAQGRSVVWEGMDKFGRRFVDYIPPALIQGRPNNQRMQIRLVNGSVIQIKGADRYNSLMGGNPVGILLDEYSLIHPLSWDYLRPILAENDGWAMFVYTPRGRNHGEEIYLSNLDNPDWYIQKLNCEETYTQEGNRVITPKIIEEERRAGMPEEMIQQEFYCSFESANAGSYFGEHLRKAREENRIGNLPLNGKPVFTFWDIGVHDANAIWFMQPDGGHLNMIHYYENTDVGVEHYLKYLEEFAQKNKIKYAEHFAPHDIQNRVYMMGAQTRFELARAKGIHFKMVPKFSIADGIDAAWRIFNRVRFDEEGCKFGLQCLQEYRKQYNERFKIYIDVPGPKWASNAADAFRYFAVAWSDFYQDPPDMRPIKIETKIF